VIENNWSYLHLTDLDALSVCVCEPQDGTRSRCALSWGSSSRQVIP